MAQSGDTGVGTGRSGDLDCGTVSAQAPSAVVLVRAEKFVPNHATAADNAFQSDVPQGESDEAHPTPPPLGRHGGRRRDALDGGNHQCQSLMGTSCGSGEPRPVSTSCLRLRR